MHYKFHVLYMKASSSATSGHEVLRVTTYDKGETFASQYKLEFWSAEIPA